MSNGSREENAPGRLLWWGGSLLSLVCAVWVAAWGLSGLVESASRDRLEATVLPLAFFERLGEQLRGVEPFAYFNLPVRAMVLTGVWLWATLGCGAWIAPRVLDRSELPLERLVFSFATGFTLLGLSVLLLGMAGLARPWAVLGLLVAAAVVAAPKGRQLAADFRAVGLPFRRPVGAHVGNDLLALFLLVVLAAVFLIALTPPIQSDGLRYHLGAPQEFLKNGRIGYLPWNAFSNFPFLVDMHFMISLAAGAPEGSQLMSFVLALATAGAVAAFVQRFVDTPPDRSTSQNGDLLPAKGDPPVSPPLLAGATYLAIPAGLVLAAWPFIDHGVALFFLLSLYSLLLALRRSTNGTWALAGLMAGAVLGTKYTALPHAALLAGIALVEWVVFSPPAATGSLRTMRPRQLAVAALVATAVGGVWFGKNLLLTGNPVYPLANGIFQGGDWTKQSAALYQSKTEEKGKPKTVENLLRSPVDATFGWTRYESHFLGSTLLVVLVSALAGLTGALLRYGSRARPLAYTALVAGAYYGAWFFSYQSNRMLVPFLALTLPLAAVLLREGAATSRWLGRLAVLPFAVCVLYGGLWAVQWQYGRAPYPSPLAWALGGLLRDEYLTRAVPYYRAFQEQEKLARPGEQVLLVGEHRILYAGFEAVWSDWFDTPAVLGIMREARASNADELLEELRRRGIRWIFYNVHELSLGQPPQVEVYFRPRFTEREWQIFQDLLARPELERRTVTRGIYLLRIPEGGSAK